MRLQPQLYIDTSGNPFGVATFERIDFFGFESIELNSTVLCQHLVRTIKYSSIATIQC